MQTVILCVIIACLSVHSAGAVPEPFVFVHIPKTAGSTLTAAFKKLWESKQCQELDVNKADAVLSLKSAFQNGSEQPCLWAHLHASPDRDDRGVFARGVLNGSVPPTNFLAGHVPHGYCAFMRKGCKHVTVLRDPVDRVLSHYHYLKSMHPGLVEKACRNCSSVDGFAAALAAGAVSLYGFDNLQTRMLAGDGFWATVSGNSACEWKHAGQKLMATCDISGTVDHQMLKKAVQNLRQYMAVGIVEDIESFTKKMGLGHLGFLNKGTEYSKDLNPDTYALLQRSQAWDMQLYSMAKQLANSKGQ